MENLTKFDLVHVIKEAADRKIPFLGICLGLQLLFEGSEETPGVEGLGILKEIFCGFRRRKGLKFPIWDGIPWNFPEMEDCFRGLGKIRMCILFILIT